MSKGVKINMSRESNENFSGMLSDNDIRSFWGEGINIFSAGNGEVSFDLSNQLQLGSIDLHFRNEGNKFKLKNDDTLTYMRLKKHDYLEPFDLKSGEKLVIRPGEIIITTTLEIVQLSAGFAGIITGRSSIARMGIMVQCCQEFINPGHGQTIPLQIINLSPCTVELDLDTPICQLILFKLRTPASGKYKDDINSKYSGEIKPQGSKMYLEASDTQQGNDLKKKRPRIDFKNVRKQLDSFLPSMILVFLIYPIIKQLIENQSLSDLIKFLGELPLEILLGIGLLFIYLWIHYVTNKGEQK